MVIALHESWFDLSVGHKELETRRSLSKYGPFLFACGFENRRPGQSNDNVKKGWSSRLTPWEQTGIVSATLVTDRDLP